MKIRLHSDLASQWMKADSIRRDFYDEKKKVDSLLREVLNLCNNVTTLRTKKKSIVRSVVRSLRNTK